MIYIAPPYDAGNDFIYPDNYAAPLEIYLQLTGQTDAEGNILTSNAETSGRYHLMEQTSPPMRLTRRTLLEIISRAPDPQAAVDNPTEFATATVTIIKQKLTD